MTELVRMRCFRWLPGMQVLFGGVYPARLGESMLADADQGDRPDLRDAATRGCLLQLVRDLSGDPLICPAARIGPHGVIWAVDASHGRIVDDQPTEADALVAALGRYE